MRTVRSVARSRNQPRSQLAMVLVAVLLLVCVLVARADARPAEDDRADDVEAAERLERGDRDERGDGDDAYESDPRRESGRHAALYVPITNAMIDRVVTIAPPVARVLDAAYRVAGLGGDPTNGWRRRSRLAALIPSISAYAGQNHAWREVDDPTISRGVGFNVRVAWRLDELLFDSNETRIATLDVARRRDRRRLAAYVIGLYYDWVAARAASMRDTRAVLDVAEKTAELDALTDGWFSGAVAKRAELQ